MVCVVRSITCTLNRRFTTFSPFIFRIHYCCATFKNIDDNHFVHNRSWLTKNGHTHTHGKTKNNKIFIDFSFSSSFDLQQQMWHKLRVSLLSNGKITGPTFVYTTQQQNRNFPFYGLLSICLNRNFLIFDANQVNTRQLTLWIGGARQATRCQFSVAYIRCAQCSNTNWTGTECEKFYARLVWFVLTLSARHTGEIQ